MYTNKTTFIPFQCLIQNVIPAADIIASRNILQMMQPQNRL